MVGGCWGVAAGHDPFLTRWFLAFRWGRGSTADGSFGLAVGRAVGANDMVPGAMSLASLLVVVEPGAGFAAEEAAADHALEQWWWGVGGLFEFFVEHVGD